MAWTGPCWPCQSRHILAFHAAARGAKSGPCAALRPQGPFTPSCTQIRAFRAPAKGVKSCPCAASRPQGPFTPSCTQPCAPKHSPPHPSPAPRLNNRLCTPRPNQAPQCLAPRSPSGLAFRRAVLNRAAPCPICAPDAQPHDPMPRLCAPTPALGAPSPALHREPMTPSRPLSRPFPRPLSRPLSRPLARPLSRPLSRPPL